MGWYESKVYQSAWPQVENTAGVILDDPYLMPPCPVFYPVFEDLGENDRELAKSRIVDMMKGIVKSLHNVVANLGAGDYEIDLFQFWKFLLAQGEKSGYSHFVYLPCEGEPEGIQDMEIQYLLQPLCIWAKMKYLAASLAHEKEGFIKPCLAAPQPAGYRGNIGADFLRAIGLESEIPAMNALLGEIE
jgi:hypothetical protein